MKRSHFDAERLLELADLAAEGGLTESTQRELESIVIEHRGAAELYAHYLAMHADLQLSLPPSSNPKTTSVAPPIVAETLQMKQGRSAYQLPGLGPSSVLAILSAVCLSFAVLILFWGSSRSPRIIATLVQTNACRWDSGTLPTEQGARLVPGRLRLVEGLARIEFANGVDLRLESPADIELVSPMKCIVHRGQLIAKVPPNAKGFMVETPTSVITDFGTEFGVSIDDTQSSVVQVFQGRVDAFHRSSKKTETMLGGSSIQFRERDYSPLNHAEQSVVAKPEEADDRVSQGERWIQISTAQGWGRDAFVQPMETPLDRQSKVLLLVKRPREDLPQWERRVYIGLDLRELTGQRIGEVELNLTFAPTGFGFATLTPDASFHVYGLIDERLDDWDEEEIRWKNAPGCKNPREPLDDSLVQYIGSFEIAQGEQSVNKNVKGERLKRFLEQDTNGKATLIVLRETEGRGGSDLVHGIASRRHPTLPPPTLRVQLLKP